ncbi:MAG: hypothetical protein ACRYFX_15240 [Janthinobacterium lividum]
MQVDLPEPFLVLPIGRPRKGSGSFRVAWVPVNTSRFVERKASYYQSKIMKVGKQFNTLTYGEYLHLIEHHQRFSDFNTLGLFRSIVETTKLSLEQKLELRKIAITAFPKTFDFLQLKDPTTYFKVNTMGNNLTEADKAQAWKDIRNNQQLIIKNKKLNHRNFGTYSKHECGYDSCHLNGLMIRRGSVLAYGDLCFNTDRNHYAAQLKSQLYKQNRKAQRQITNQLLNEE